MQMTVFWGDQLRIASTDRVFGYITAIVVPTLSAYAIAHIEFAPSVNIDFGGRTLYEDQDFSIDGDRIDFLPGFSDPFRGFNQSRLTVHYHGIRDYALLFPQVADNALRHRLGQFYEEAEKAFGAGAWLSFALMAGAVYEGLLYWRLDAGDAFFGELIGRAKASNLITEKEATILDVARDARNLIHASRYKEAGVTRSRAMDLRTALERLTRRLSG